MITSATTAKRYKDILLRSAHLSEGDLSFIQWQAHDFSMRGMFGLEASAMSGAGHLLSFTGTDTIPAIAFLEQYYKANVEKELVGASVPATEHSVMCAGGKENEYSTYERLITKTYPKGIVSIVSDTWDLWNVVGNFLPKLKEQIMARDGKVVIRPDSGDPTTILAGHIIAQNKLFMHQYKPEVWSNFCYKEKDKFYKVKPASLSKTGHNETIEISAYEAKGVVECLWDIFGGTTTEKGYRMLDSHIGAIYGDSITPERATDIMSRLINKKFASTNVVLGVGSFSYQHVTRDTYGFAVKATYCEIDGKPVEIFKDPITDDGLKKSAKGLLAVYKNEGDGALYLKDQATREEANNCELELVFKDGKLVREQSLAEIRAIVSLYDPKAPEKTVKEVIKDKLEETV